MIRTVVIISSLVIMFVVDGKRFAAYSSVLHISLCVILGLMVMILVRYMHIVLSPLMFISVYMMYQINGSRFYIKAGLIMLVLWMVNFGLPFLGSFFSEVYIIQYRSVILLILVLMYLIVGYVMMKSINMEGKGLFV